MSSDVKYPELEKMKRAREALRPQAIVLGGFIDWLGENGFYICTHNPKHYKQLGGMYYWTTLRPEQLLAKFFDIDMDKVEKERELVLDAQRKLNEERG